MNQKQHDNARAVEKQRPIPTVSAVFGDGAILEMVHRPDEKRTGFALWRDEKWTIESAFEADPFRR
ncbi:MAG: hypothetical protein DMG09_29440, partial [Acidobacteria bacterium]